jgi:predicted PolB exonuclease-like 3'-5' exonuclease
MGGHAISEPEGNFLLDFVDAQAAPFPPPYAHRVVVAGVLWLDPTYGLKRLGTFIGDGSGERSLLADLARFLAREQPRLITFNGRGFDLPVLAARCLRWGVPMSRLFDRDVRYRYQDDGHVDVCDQLTDYGAVRPSSLDGLARSIGLPGKQGVDGSQVEGLWLSGGLDQIRTYCMGDVVQTAFLFLRWLLLRGQFGRFGDLVTSTGIAEKLLTGIAETNQVPQLVEAIDRNRLLLVEPPEGA